MLPLTRHRSGRAAPLPDAAPEAPAAPPAPEPKAAEPPRVVIPDCSDDDPDVITELTGDVGAAEIAGAAGRFGRASQLARERAEADQAEAGRVMTEARAQVAQIMASAEAASSVLSKSAGQAARQADALGERARWLAAAASGIAEAVEAEDRADALEDERDRLAASAEDLARKIAALAAERDELAGRMDAARDAGDIGSLAALRSRDSAAAEVAAALTKQRDAVISRIEVIGDGTETFSTHPLLRAIPPLSAARQAADGARRSARQALNMTFPERPEAVDDARRAELMATIDLLQESAAGARQDAPQPRTFVQLG